MIDISRGPHPLSLRYPSHRHRRFRLQPQRHCDLFCVPLGPLVQLFLSPSPASQFFRYDPFGMLLHRLLPLRPVMLGSHPFLHLLQQLFAERFWSQTPAAAQLLVVGSRLPRSPLLQSGLQLPSSPRVVSGNAAFPPATAPPATTASVGPVASNTPANCSTHIPAMAARS